MDILQKHFKKDHVHAYAQSGRGFTVYEGVWVCDALGPIFMVTVEQSL